PRPPQPPGLLDPPAREDRRVADRTAARGLGGGVVDRRSGRRPIAVLAVDAPQPPPRTAAARAGLPVPEPGPGDHEPGTVARRQPAPRADPDGDRVRQDPDRDHGPLPADQVR